MRRTLFVALLAAACLYTYRLELTETRTYAGARVSNLTIDTRNGRVAATTTTDSTIAVSITRQAYGRDSADAARAIAGVQISEQVAGDQIALKAEMPASNRNYGASFAVTCPANIALDLTSSNGEISANGANRGVKATTSNGRITLSSTRGPAVLSTSNGDVSVTTQRGSIEAGTSNGRIDCDIAELDSASTVRLETSNGPVTLLLPEGTSATVDITTSSGTMVIRDFAFTLVEQTTTHLRARVGDGDCSVTIRTSNGDVLVRRR